MYQLYRDRPLLLLTMVLANIALSAWCLIIDPVINNDGVTYLAIAQMMLDGEWAKSFDYYSWPYYSVFIAATAKIFFLEVETAAHLLNAILATSLTLAFVCIVAELSNNNRSIIMIAMLVILFFPSITKYRSFIIRDFGYLSCYLWSLYFIFRFCSTLNKSHLIGWLLFAALSCLFRFEGVAFLLIAPYFLLLFTARRMPHRRKILSVLSVLIISVSVALVIWYINDKYASMIEVAREQGKDIHNVIDLFLANIKEKLGGAELTPLRSTSMFAKDVTNVVYELVRRMAVFYFLFSVYGYIRGLGFTSNLMKRIWIVYVATNFLMLVGFSLYNNFLVSRYTMATALTLLILSPFVINQLLLNFKNTSQVKRVASIISIGILLLASLEGMGVHTKKKHIKEAGLWLKSEVGDGASFYSNDRLMHYYVEEDAAQNLTHSPNNIELRAIIDKRQFRRFDYFALSVNPKSKLEDYFRQTLSYYCGRPIKIFEGTDGRAAYIFKTKKD